MSDGLFPSVVTLTLCLHGCGSISKDSSHGLASVENNCDSLDHFLSKPTLCQGADHAALPRDAGSL